ncbi:SpoIIE family protein phosphatase [Kineococcus sp. NBC_00420]|uniref:SpoIIE family protein phosphatase n=1 Tax=Kineococcus sp. NBC_00420 TaxID=2903564 RepID=UPI002E2481EF
MSVIGREQRLPRIFAALPFPCMLLDPDLVILEVSGAYLQATGRPRAELVGRYLFEAFPLAQAAPSALPGHEIDSGGGGAEVQDPQVLVRASMLRVLATGVADPVPLQKYDIPDADSPTGFSERWWSFTTFPVFGAAAEDEKGAGAGGQVAALLHVTEDVTKEITRTSTTLSGRGATQEEVEQEVQRSTAALRGRAQQLEADLYERAVQVQALTAAREQAVTRLAGLARTALALAEAGSVLELTNQITEHGLAATGCDSGAVAVFTPGDATMMDLTITDGFGAATQRNYARLPADSVLPACVAASTGRTVLLSDAAACLAWSPQMRDVMDSTGSQAFACLPLVADGRVLGSLTAGWHQPQTFDAEQVELLDAFAAQCAQVLDRLLVHEAEIAAHAEAAAAWETLQRSMLTEPPEPDHLQVVVRYRAAARTAQIGGDWYDAFFQPDGSTVLVIGDVIGHDTIAAAAMGQVRTMLRAVAAHSGDGPAAVLSATDRLLRLLMISTSATAVVARLEQTAQEHEDGVSRLRFSNAGHLPPLVLDTDGRPRLLEAVEANLLLGIDADTPRQESVVTLERESTVILYTDGLVERRGESLQVGLERLAEVAGELAQGGVDLDGLVDGLLQRLVPEQPEDDVALIAVRLHPQDVPRPAVAGPNRIPDVVPPEQ